MTGGALDLCYGSRMQPPLGGPSSSEMCRFCCRSGRSVGIGGMGREGSGSFGAVLRCCPSSNAATLRWRKAQRGQWRRSSDKLGEAPQILGDGPEHELVLCATWAAQSKSTEPQDTFQVCEPHLDALAIAPRLLEGISADERSGDIACVLVNVARDLSCWFLWTAPRFEETLVAIELAGTIKKRRAVMHRAARSEFLASRAVVDVSLRVVSKVAAREGAVFALRLVNDGDVRRDLLFLDQPVEHRRRAVSRVGCEPVGLEAKAFLCALEHCPGGPDFGLANG